MTISGKATIDGTAGNDFIIGTGTSPQTIHTGAGNDIVYATNDASSTIYCDGGNNTIIAGADKFATIYLGEGNDTIYTSSDNDTGNNIFINNSIIDGGHDTIYWQGAANTNIRLNKTLYDDVALTQDGTDVILRYGNDNTVTVKDYNSISPNVGFSFYNVTNFKRKNALITEKGIKEYIEGSGTIAGTSANEYIKGSDGADSLTSNGDDVLNGGAGNDTYYVSSLTDSTAIIDSAGSDILNSDILNIAASKSDIKILFNVNSDGSFDSVYDKLYLVDSDTFDACIDSHSMPTSGIKISDFDSIETINATDGQIANLSQLKSDVANWLTDDGRSYGSVAAALEDPDADLTTLIAIFDRAANWQ